jgi:hypothetical protein
MNKPFKAPAVYGMPGSACMMFFAVLFAAGKFAVTDYAIPGIPFILAAAVTAVILGRHCSGRRRAPGETK